MTEVLLLKRDDKAVIRDDTPVTFVDRAFISSCISFTGCRSRIGTEFMTKK